LRSIPGVVHVNSLVDTMKRLNKNMHGDRKEYYTLPTSREMASQYLLLYEMSLPYGLDLNNQIDIDKSSSRVIVTLGNLKTAEMLAINEKAEQWLVTNAPEHMRTLGSSPAIMFSHVSERNVVSMAWATLFAFILITFVMIFALRSVKYGLLSLLPNVIPAIIGYGLWSIFVGEAGFAIAVVGSVTLGIVVDDTVHFLAKYALAKKENNFSADEAVKYAFENVGSALIATSVILVIGFSILMFSTFKMNFILGALSALTIGVALIIDFTFLPAVLYLMDKEKNKTGDIMKAKNITAVIFVGLLAFGFSNSVFAKENKGLWVANQIDKADSGFINQVAKTKMILRNKKGQESIREMRIKTLEVQNDGDKSLTIFDSPRDVKGTAFLSYSHSVKSDDQWLYMPAIKRVKSISSNNKSGPFMGSEFAYEDISSQEVDKYTYKFIKEETVLGEKGYVIERYPVDKKSGYTKQVVWVDGKEWRVARIDFYDRKATLLKTLVYKGYKKYDNGKWRPASMEMKNHQNEKSTSLIWKEIKFGRDLSKRDFDKNALKRIR
jgi:outer membrane lipoprotein-sorting protein